MSDQAAATAANREFWDELCGSQHAAALGIQGNGPEDLARFDEYFFGYYPYLDRYLSRVAVLGKRVLEIGLGYGTVGHRLKMEAGLYVGMDVAAGPAAMMAHRHQLLGKPPSAVQGNALAMPFPDATFDTVISIGCLHHTGDFPRAVREVHRVLRPGGQALVMVYHRFSYYQWLKWPLRTLRALLGAEGRRTVSHAEQRRQADANVSGEAAPVTDFFSEREVRRIFGDFAEVSCHRENCYDHGVLARFGLGRDRLLPHMGQVGLDLYAVARR